MKQMDVPKDAKLYCCMCGEYIFDKTCYTTIKGKHYCLNCYNNRLFYDSKITDEEVDKELEKLGD